jgi:amino acid transporter
VLVFLATTLACVINPDLSQYKAFLVPVMLVIFWAVTLSSLFGALKSARWTGIGVVIGTAVPTAAIIGLGLWWVGSGIDCRRGRVASGLRRGKDGRSCAVGTYRWLA